MMRDKYAFYFLLCAKNEEKWEMCALRGETLFVYRLIRNWPFLWLNGNQVFVLRRHNAHFSPENHLKLCMWFAISMPFHTFTRKKQPPPEGNWQRSLPLAVALLPRRGRAARFSLHSNLWFYARTFVVCCLLFASVRPSSSSYKYLSSLWRWREFGAAQRSPLANPVPLATSGCELWSFDGQLHPPDTRLEFKFKPAIQTVPIYE